MGVDGDFSPNDFNVKEKTDIPILFILKIGLFLHPKLLRGITYFKHSTFYKIRMALIFFSSIYWQCGSIGNGRWIEIKI